VLKLIIAAFFYAWIAITAAADLYAAVPTDNWTQDIAVPTSATDSGASTYSIVHPLAMAPSTRAPTASLR
jgi:hypothetical protein